MTIAKTLGRKSRSKIISAPNHGTSRHAHRMKGGAKRNGKGSAGFAEHKLSETITGNLSLQFYLEVPAMFLKY